MAKKVRGVEKIIGSGRNDLCKCGSGKKYKKCCLKSDLKAKELKIVDKSKQNKPSGLSACDVYRLSLIMNRRGDGIYGRR